MDIRVKEGTEREGRRVFSSQNNLISMIPVDLLIIDTIIVPFISL